MLFGLFIFVPIVFLVSLVHIVLFTQVFIGYQFGFGVHIVKYMDGNLVFVRR